MSGGVSIEYAHARVSARLGQRPDERLWQQLRASRRLAALLDSVRASPAAAYVSGVDARAPLDAIELAFRQQLRLRVDEVAQWAPDAWVEAVMWVRPLVDLPALVYLDNGGTALAWMKHDPELAAYALSTPAERRATLRAGPLAPIAEMLVAEVVEAAGRPPARPTLHPALAAWERHWRTLWPDASDDERTNLDALAAIIRQHALAFPQTPPGDAADGRALLAARVSSLMRRAAAQPAALFAWLALFALDLERLRGEFATRAAEDAGIA
jgi:hypothetical protein